MTGLGALLRRNIKLFFKDKATFFTSLITPVILLVLYATFLGDVYRDTFLASFQPYGIVVPEAILEGFVAGQLLSSLLAVSCVTVSFCSNMLMVQDKVNQVRRDLTITPVKRSTLALSYYLSTSATSLIIFFLTAAAGFLYIALVGWYLSAADVFFILLDVFLLVMFGTALSSAINFFLSTQGQISAMGTIISSGYGFLCGAYMPISQFGEGLQTVLSFLPGTYGTALLRNHCLNGVFRDMQDIGYPPEVIDGIKEAMDCCPQILGEPVSISGMYGILGVSVVLLIGLYVLFNCTLNKQESRK